MNFHSLHTVVLYFPILFGPTISHLKLAIELTGLTLWDRGKAEIIIIIIIIIKIIPIKSMLIVFTL